MEYVTIPQCEKNRTMIGDKVACNTVDIAKLLTDMAYTKKMVWVIISVLVSGFTGVIFSIYSVGV